MNKQEQELIVKGIKVDIQSPKDSGSLKSLKKDPAWVDVKEYDLPVGSWVDKSNSQKDALIQSSIQIAKEIDQKDNGPHENENGAISSIKTWTTWLTGSEKSKDQKSDATVPDILDETPVENDGAEVEDGDSELSSTPGGSQESLPSKELKEKHRPDSEQKDLKEDTQGNLEDDIQSEPEKLIPDDSYDKNVSDSNHNEGHISDSDELCSTAKGSQEALSDEQTSLKENKTQPIKNNLEIETRNSMDKCSQLERKISSISVKSPAKINTTRVFDLVDGKNSSPASFSPLMSGAVRAVNPIIENLLLSIKLLEDNDESLKNLDLKDVAVFRPSHGVMLAKALQQNTHIESLNLSNIQLQTSTAIEIAKVS